MLAPADRAAALVGLLHRDVGHEAIRGGAVPVILAGLEVDAVAGADDLDRSLAALAEPHALGDPDRLAERVRVPGGARARGEVDAGSLQPRRRRRGGYLVDVHRPGEPLGGAGRGVERVASDLHGVLLRSRRLTPPTAYGTLAGWPGLAQARPRVARGCAAAAAPPWWSRACCWRCRRPPRPRRRSPSSARA